MVVVVGGGSPARLSNCRHHQCHMNHWAGQAVQMRLLCCRGRNGCGNCAACLTEPMLAMMEMGGRSVMQHVCDASALNHM